GQTHDVVLEFVDLDVADAGEQTDLVGDQQQCGVVSCEANPAHVKSCRIGFNSNKKLLSSALTTANSSGKEKQRSQRSSSAGRARALILGSNALLAVWERTNRRQR